MTSKIIAFIPFKKQCYSQTQRPGEIVMHVSIPTQVFAIRWMQEYQNHLNSIGSQKK